MKSLVGPQTWWCGIGEIADGEHEPKLIVGCELVPVRACVNVMAETVEFDIWDAVGAKFHATPDRHPYFVFHDSAGDDRNMLVYDACPMMPMAGDEAWLRPKQLVSIPRPHPDEVEAARRRLAERPSNGPA